MSFHYKYGGSTATRTLECPGWVLESEGKENKSSVFADRGTVCHTACEKLYEDESLEYYDLVNLGIKEGEVALDQELVDSKVVPAFEALLGVLEDYKTIDSEPELQVEYDPEIGGTIDFWGVLEGNGRMALDYKFGDGEMVYAENNNQLMFYIWAGLTSEDSPISEEDVPDRIILGIIQPAERKEDIVDLWETTGEEIMAFGDRFIEAVNIAEESGPGENLNPGDHCKYCPAKVSCSARNALVGEALEINPEDFNAPEVISEISKADLVRALDLADKLKKWAADIKQYAEDQLNLGLDISDHWKLIPKGANRSWVDAGWAEKYLKRLFKAENAMEATVLSPAKAEKYAKANKIKINLKDRTQKVSKGVNLVRASHKTPAITSQKEVAESFKKLGALK